MATQSVPSVHQKKAGKTSAIAEISVVMCGRGGCWGSEASGRVGEGGLASPLIPCTRATTVAVR